MPSFTELVTKAEGLAAFEAKARKYALPRALVFTDAKDTTPLLKFASTELRRRLLIAEVKQSQQTAAIFTQYEVGTVPHLLVIPSGTNGAPIRYTKDRFSLRKVLNFLEAHALKKTKTKKGKKTRGTIKE